MIKLTTFIRALKIALYSVYEKTKGWDSVYVSYVTFPQPNDTSGNRVKFVFSNQSEPEEGCLGISIIIKTDMVSMLSDNINLYDLMKDAASEINSAIKLYEALTTVFRFFTVRDEDVDTDVKISSIYFKNNCLYLQTDAYDEPIYTDGVFTVISN